MPNGHGHVGDGNLHLNVVLPGYEDKSLQERTKATIEPFVMDYVRKVQGSISAEHGLGRLKSPFLNYSKTLSSIELMKGIKDLMDSRGILNPGKVFPTL